jgi:hypothetical protein
MAITDYVKSITYLKILKYYVDWYNYIFGNENEILLILTFSFFT